MGPHFCTDQQSSLIACKRPEHGLAPFVLFGSPIYLQSQALEVQQSRLHRKVESHDTLLATARHAGQERFQQRYHEISKNMHASSLLLRKAFKQHD